MRITIGELVDELAPYSNIVNVSVTNGIPFVRAYLSDGTNFTKAYLYIVQVSEHVYSAIDDYDDQFGRRYFPTGSMSRAFVQELDVIKLMFGGMPYHNEPQSSIENVGYEEMISYIYKRLYDYRCIRFNPKNYDVKLCEMGFNNVKLRRVIEKAFLSHGIRNGSIKDLIDITNIHHRKFNLDGLRDRDIQCIQAKLRDLSLSLEVENSCGTHVLFGRKN